MKNKKTKDKENKDELEDYKDVTVAEMNVDGMRWYKSEEDKEKRKNVNKMKITKGERRAMIKGAFIAMLPAYLIGLAVFCAAFGLLILFLYLHAD